MNLRLSESLRVVISGGGTGGHIFPALAIANTLKKKLPASEILFVGALGKMEMEKVPAAGYKIIGLPVSGFKRALTAANFGVIYRLWKSLRLAGKIIRDFQPDVAVGVGGYASGPVLYKATSAHIPAVIQEQNSYPGVTNRLLAGRVMKICVAYEGMEKYFPSSKMVMTGNPVREQSVQIEGKRPEACLHFGLDAGLSTLLIVGGSQGARSINHCIRDGLNRIHESGLQVIWQTGKQFVEEAEQEVKKLGTTRVRVYAFLDRMDLAYAMADLVISRAGASTVSELCIVKKPAILVPLPSAAEDHQTRNCIALVNKQAAILVKDQDAQHDLIDRALELSANENLRASLAANIAPLAVRDAAERIVNEIISLGRKSKQ